MIWMVALCDVILFFFFGAVLLAGSAKWCTVRSLRRWHHVQVQPYQRGGLGEHHVDVAGSDVWFPLCVSVSFCVSVYL